MLNEYFIRRLEKLSGKLTENKNKYEHNLIAIKESKNKIDKLKNSIDEASNIFSVKAREDNGFKQQEIVNLETKIAAYVIENKEYKEIIDIVEKELEEIRGCQVEVNKLVNNVSRETFSKNNNININDYNEMYSEENNSCNKQLEINIENLENEPNIIYDKSDISENIYKFDDTLTYNCNDYGYYNNQKNYMIKDDSDMKVVVDGITTDKKTADIISKLKICKKYVGVDEYTLLNEIDDIISILKK